jgi:hypothetical protein
MVRNQCLLFPQISALMALGRLPYANVNFDKYRVQGMFKSASWKVGTRMQVEVRAKSDCLSILPQSTESAHSGDSKQNQFGVFLRRNYDIERDIGLRNRELAEWRAKVACAA